MNLRPRNGSTAGTVRPSLNSGRGATARATSGPTLRPADRRLGGLGSRYGAYSIAGTQAYLNSSYHWGGHYAGISYGCGTWNSWGCYSPYRWCGSWSNWWWGCWNSCGGYWGSGYWNCSGYWWWWPNRCYLPGSWFGYSYFDRWCYGYTDWAYWPVGSTEVVRTEPAEVVEDGEEPADEVALAEHHLRLGDFYFKEGRYDEAVEAYLKALSYAPDDGSIHFVLADALFAQGDYHYASFMVSRGLDLDPSLATASTDKREFYGDPTEFDRQMEVLGRYLVEKPYDAAGHLLMGYNLKFSGRPEKAVVSLGRVLEIDPGHRAARALLVGFVDAGKPPAEPAPDAVPAVDEK